MLLGCIYTWIFMWLDISCVIIQDKFCMQRVIKIFDKIFGWFTLFFCCCFFHQSITSTEILLRFRLERMLQSHPFSFDTCGQYECLSPSSTIDLVGVPGYLLHSCPCTLLLNVGNSYSSKLLPGNLKIYLEFWLLSRVHNIDGIWVMDCACIVFHPDNIPHRFCLTAQLVLP